MAVIYADVNDFDEKIKEGLIVLDFYADWCGPCKMIGPVLEAIDAENEDIKVVKVNVDENISLAQRYGVQGIPALFVLKDSEVIGQRAGFMPKEALVNWVKSL
ncbi:thioredoxin [Candidatus Izimaplasma bacterium ZiA1]|uniref:thioredoxin n=1 Tax=Candidatus Izimoplasma sp. ZiA1 TaxID=2024899 RepID=UPI000BAA7BB1|nr:thioredoxin [Candidatus Izimaplasma bacterium ZiA1]